MTKKKAIQYKKNGDEDFKNQNYNGAISKYERAIELDPSYIETWYCLGRALTESKQDCAHDILFCYNQAGNFKDAKTLAESIEINDVNQPLQLNVTRKIKENLDFWKVMKKCRNRRKETAILLIGLIINAIPLFWQIITGENYPTTDSWVITPILIPLLIAVLYQKNIEPSKSIEKQVLFLKIRDYYTLFFVPSVLIYIFCIVYYLSIPLLNLLSMGIWAFLLYWLTAYGPIFRTDIGRFIQKLRIFNYQLQQGNLGQVLNLARDIKWIFRKEGLQIENYKDIEKQLNKKILQDSNLAIVEKENKVTPNDEKNILNLYPNIIHNLIDSKEKISFRKLFGLLDLPNIDVSKQSLLYSFYSFAETAGKVISVIAPYILIPILTLVLTGKPE